MANEEYQKPRRGRRTSPVTPAGLRPAPRNQKAAGWLLRAGFFVAVGVAVWLSRPEASRQQPPQSPAPAAATTESSRDRSASRTAATRDDEADRQRDADAIAAEDRTLRDERRLEEEDFGESPTGSVSAQAERDPEVQATLDRIARGGPYPFRQDDTTFFNREQRLPVKPLGYYREFTVRTPGADDRGARRIVLGEEGELYLTLDHYQSFVPISAPAAGNRNERGPPRGAGTTNGARRSGGER